MFDRRLIQLLRPRQAEIRGSDLVSFIRTAYILFLITLIGGSGFIFWKLEHKVPVLSYNEFIELLENNEIAEVRFRGSTIIVKDKYDRQFSTYSPDISQLTPRLLDRKIRIYGQSDNQSDIWNFLTIVVPILMIMLVWYMMVRRSGEKETSSDFGKGKALTMGHTEKSITFRDVAGIPEAKDELLEIVDFLQRPRKYSQLGAIIPKGILFQGPPGTGKTLLAKAIAGEAGVPFYSISGSDFVEMFVGVGASRVRDLFREAKKNTPCIIFIDEIDAVGGHRAATGQVGGQEERGQTLNALLVEMDGFSSGEKIIVIAATNRPDMLDPALLRPGRFDRMINILPPDVKGRRKILDVHTRKVRLAPSVDLDEVAMATPGFTGAELASLVNEAALIAGRKEKEAIDHRDFEMAQDRILMGIERKGLVISEKDKRTMACHEAGHAIVARSLPDADPLHKITIIPRGKAMGHTQQLPLQDRHAYTLEYLQDRITILMGGRAAEVIMLDQLSTGAEGDLQQAVEIATNMVCKWGMSEKLGPLAYVNADQGFLGNFSSYKNFSERTAELIDREVKDMVERCYKNAQAALEQEKNFLEHLTEVLLKTETLDREEMEIIYECSIRKARDAADESGNDFCEPDRA